MTAPASPWQPTAQAVEDAIERTRDRSRGRTRYAGQQPYDDETLVAEIERLRDQLDQCPGCARQPDKLGLYGERLSYLETLTDGWHDGDGKAPTAQALAAARGLLTSRPGSARRRIYPTDAGGLLIEFVDAGWDRTVEIQPDGSCGLPAVRVEAEPDGLAERGA